MAKKKDEKDVLVVRDEQTGELSVVAGLNADGTPKRTPAKAENAQSFLQFDRHGDVLDNFFKNFFRQCKEPSRFGFYRIAADQAENLLEVMKQLLKDPEANKELLAHHKVDTSDYEKKAVSYTHLSLGGAGYAQRLERAVRISGKLPSSAGRGTLPDGRRGVGTAPCICKYSKFNWSCGKISK